MKKKLTISFILLFFFCSSCRAQSLSASDKLEKATIDFLKKRKKNNSKNTDSSINSLIVQTYSVPDNQYIISLAEFDRKLCKESSSFIYKIIATDKNTYLYFMNRFITPVILNEENTSFFLTNEECEITTGTIYEPIFTMLLIDKDFSIKKKIRGMNPQSLIEDILCPTTPTAIIRAKIRKKYSHL